MTAEEKRERVARKGILANFQFYINDRPQKICEGITLNVSDFGYRFLTETVIREGQTITITSHTLRNFPCPKARVAWVKKGPRCFEAGVKAAPIPEKTAN